ncbi:MAG: tetratricopeptide repeat protein, partial [Anaerolineales bacterium]|nr:tetratricopeptide repeat protein [Anaerolineales bacterium]
MEIQDPRVRSLLRQANKVAESGKKAAAEQLYRQILEEAPDVAEAWYGLGQV